MALARSMILSGEQMTPTAEAVFDEALGYRAAQSDGPEEAT